MLDEEETRNLLWYGTCDPEEVARIEAEQDDLYAYFYANPLDDELIGDGAEL